MSWHQFKQAYLVKFWAPFPSVIALGLLSTYYFGLTGTFWAVTGEFTRWGGHALQGLGFQPETWGYFQIIGLSGTPFTRIDGVMILGMFAGCLGAALLANNVKFRQPRQKKRIYQALIGGIIAGFGARLAMGCNLAAFFTGIPQFSLHAWFFALATALGSYIGTKVMLHPRLMSRATLQKAVKKAPVMTRSFLNIYHFYIGSVVLVGFLGITLVYLYQVPVLGIAALFGLGFGIVIERAQICFTSAFRDLWITGRSLMAKAIIAGMAVSAIGIFSYIELGLAPKILWAGPNAALGGLLFGFGIVLAGGCETGWMYRAVEGQVHFWWVGLGNIIGATLLAVVWEDIAPVLVLEFDKINLLVVFGKYGGLIVTYALLAFALAAVMLWERYFFSRLHQSNT